MIETIASDEVLEQAYRWLCKARKDAHHNYDVWHLRFHWHAIKPRLQQQLLRGDYLFSPCTAYQVNGESIGQWCAEDSLVLKAMTLVLSENLAPHLSQDCYHLAGRGGTKACVMKIK